MLDPDVYAEALTEFTSLTARERQLNEELVLLRFRTTHLVTLLLPEGVSDDVIAQVLCQPPSGL